MSSFFGLGPRALNAPEAEEESENEVEDPKAVEDSKAPGGFSEGDVAGLSTPFGAISKAFGTYTGMNLSDSSHGL